MYGEICTLCVKMYNYLDHVCWKESNVILTDSFNTHIFGFSVWLSYLIVVLLVLLRYMYNSDSNKNVKNQ